VRSGQNWQKAMQRYKAERLEKAGAVGEAERVDSMSKRAQFWLSVKYWNALNLKPFGRLI